MNSFNVVFEDGEVLVINDVIEFEEQQIKEIVSTALSYTRYALTHAESTGISISYMTDIQKQTVIDKKNSIITGIPSQTLLNSYTVQITVHYNERTAERIGSDSEEIFIELIDILKTTDIVKGAKFKGYPSLSYTMMCSSDTKKAKYPISFIKDKGNHKIKMITLAPNSDNSNTPRMKRRAVEGDSDLIKDLSNLKAKLKARLKND